MPTMTDDRAQLLLDNFCDVPGNARRVVAALMQCHRNAGELDAAIAAVDDEAIEHTIDMLNGFWNPYATECEDADVHSGSDAPDTALQFPGV